MMKAVLSVAIVLAVVLLVSVQTAELLRDVVFTRTDFPNDWARTGRSDPKQQISFWIALTQKNLPQLEKIYWKTSDPENEMYGKWWTQDQILDFVAPSKADHDIVFNWAKSAGVVDIRSVRDAIQVRATAEALERLFHTTIYAFQHKQTGRLHHAAMGALTVPHSVHQRLDMILGVSDFPMPKEARAGVAIKDSITNKLQDSNGPYVIPSTIQNLMGIPAGTKASTSVSQEAVEFENVPAFSYSDLQTYATKTNSPFTNITKIYGSFQGVFTESTLDVQMITNIGVAADSRYRTVTEWMYQWGVTLFNQQDAAMVQSVSYGWPEQLQCTGSLAPGSQECQQLGVGNAGYIARTDAEFMKIGMRGITLVVCTQDEGAPSSHNNYCALDLTHPLWPMYPATSPYVLAVGGMTITSKGSSKSGAPACSQYPCATEPFTLEPAMLSNSIWTVGGGFSDFTPVPDFQKKYVSQWLAGGNFMPPSKFFNASNRAYPDCTSSGSYVLIEIQGNLEPVFGTSAATPMVAGLISLFNQYRVANGKAALGPVNQLFYTAYQKNAKTFTDITTGTNRCTTAACCKYGYGSAKGWDPVNGLGVPQYDQLLDYIKTLN